MSGPVDALAVIRKHAATSVALAGSDAYHAQEAPKLVAVAIAIAELIEADEQYDAARAHVWHTRGLKDEIAAGKALTAAKHRRRAALTNVGAEK